MSDMDMPKDFPEVTEGMKDDLIRARHVWKKGRYEFMGGPITYTQGHGVPGYENQERKMGRPPLGVNNDPMALALGVDIQEQ